MGLLEMSITGAILILVIVVIRAIAIHRLPKKTFLVLWTIALARLLLPVSVPSPLSIYSLVRGNESTFQTSDTGVYENRQSMYQVGMEQIQNSFSISDTPQTLQSAPHIPIWTMLWIVGMLILAGLFLVSYLRCRREFRTALPIHNAFITEWLDEHQLKRKIDIRQFSGISTPMTYGVIHPVILLPKNTDWENEQQLQYILFHEYVHICRYDTTLKILTTAALCIHWFNPMVWVLYILFNRDIELTCDECVIREFGRENRSAYARMLISVEERKNTFAPFCNNFSKNAIEERIESIMKTKKTSIITLVLASVIVVGTAGVFATSVQANEDNISTIEELDEVKTDTTITSVEIDGMTYQDNTALESPGGNINYSVYEPYGLLYDSQNGCYTFNGNIVRYFNDPVAGASFTNYFTGTVDLEAEYDTKNVLVGIKECSQEVYDYHTKKQTAFSTGGRTDTAIQSGTQAPDTHWLKDYEIYGVYHTEKSGWYCNGERIKILIDSEKKFVYSTDENGICLSVVRNEDHTIAEIKKITEADAKDLMQKNNPQDNGNLAVED